jgi:excisionase family DNA binding protein
LDAEFLTIKEVAVIFSCHQNTIRRALRLGFLIGIRVGKGAKSPYRISRKCIDEIHHSLIKELASKAKKSL